MRTTAGIPNLSVDHSLFIPDTSPAHQPSLALQAGTLQVETWTSRRVKQTPVPAAGVPDLDGPSLPSRCPRRTPRGYGPHRPHAFCSSFCIHSRQTPAIARRQTTCLGLGKALNFCPLQLSATSYLGLSKAPKISARSSKASTNCPGLGKGSWHGISHGRALLYRISHQQSDL